MTGGIVDQRPDAVVQRVDALGEELPQRQVPRAFRHEQLMQIDIAGVEARIHQQQAQRDAGPIGQGLNQRNLEEIGKYQPAQQTGADRRDGGRDRQGNEDAEQNARNRQESAAVTHYFRASMSPAVRRALDQRT